mmetsp:Transcript_20865/g.63587  ORF Transcript_20865/g.63587 Transcript_20865/m.63587 type:complete len:210 (-) Transcript_20865:415-1044(-)
MPRTAPPRGLAVRGVLEDLLAVGAEVLDDAVLQLLLGAQHRVEDGAVLHLADLGEVVDALLHLPQLGHDEPQPRLLLAVVRALPRLEVLAQQRDLRDAAAVVVREGLRRAVLVLLRAVHDLLLALAHLGVLDVEALARALDLLLHRLLLALDDLRRRHVHEVLHELLHAVLVRLLHRDEAVVVARVHVMDFRLNLGHLRVQQHLKTVQH